MITFKSDISRFSKAMTNLQERANVSTTTFLKNESRLLAQTLAKSFTPKLNKSTKGIGYDRREAFAARTVGASTIPWNRLQQIIRRRHPGGKRPVVQKIVAKASEKLAVSRLGLLASGFIGKGNKLGVQAPAFVLRNVGRAFGDVRLSLSGFRKTVTLRNWTPYLQNMQASMVFLVKRSIRQRTGAMRTQARLIAKGIKEYVAR